MRLLVYEVVKFQVVVFWVTKLCSLVKYVWVNFTKPKDGCLMREECTSVVKEVKVLRRP
jgi:hypothetical protein